MRNPNHDLGQAQPEYLVTTFADYFRGRPGTVTDPYGSVTRSTFDSSGNVLFSVDALGEGTEFVYSDAIERPDLPAGLPLRTYRVHDHDDDPATTPRRRTPGPDASSDYFAATDAASGAVRGQLWTSTDHRTGVTTRYAYTPEGRVARTFREWADAAGAHSVRDGLTQSDAVGSV